MLEGTNRLFNVRRSNARGTITYRLITTREVVLGGTWRMLTAGTVAVEGTVLLTGAVVLEGDW